MFCSHCGGIAKEMATVDMKIIPRKNEEYYPTTFVEIECTECHKFSYVVDVYSL